MKNEKHVEEGGFYLFYGSMSKNVWGYSGITGKPHSG
jgi:hypothetical protein